MIGSGMARLGITKRFFISFFAILPLVPLLPSQPIAPPPPGKPPGGVIIKLKNNDTLNEVMQTHNLTLIKRLDALNVVVAKTKRDPALVAESVARDRRILYAEPNFVAKKLRPVRTPRTRPTLAPSSSPTFTPSPTSTPTQTPSPTPTPTPTSTPQGTQTYTVNDPFYAKQWALTKIAWNKLNPSDATFNVSQASQKSVAIIDTGINYNHPDLVGRVDTVNDIDYVNNDTDAIDDEGHGTHVAGIVTAITNNNQGVASVGFNDLQVLPIKVLDSQGYGYYSDIALGITYAADLGVPVINLSLGGSFTSQTLQNAVNYAWGKGSLIVAAAGNSGNTQPLYPAYYSNAIAVGASDQNDKKTYFSSYGAWVDLAAPGVSILSTTGTGYESWSGTSMASPHVAALAGLIMVTKSLSNQQTRTKLETTADAMPNERQFKSGNFGKGRINVFRALTE